jgi:hypothetical protein
MNFSELQETTGNSFQGYLVQNAGNAMGFSQNANHNQ